MPRQQPPAQPVVHHQDPLAEQRDAMLAQCEHVPPPPSHHTQEIVACKNTAWHRWAEAVHVGTDVIQPALDYDNVILYAYLNGHMSSDKNTLHYDLTRGVVENRYKKAMIQKYGPQQAASEPPNHTQPQTH